MCATFLRDKGTVKFWTESETGDFAEHTFAYPNATDWRTFTAIGGTWDSAALIGIYNKDLAKNNGYGASFLVMVGSDVYAQVLGKVQAYASTVKFNAEVQDDYIQLGKFRIYDVNGSWVDYGNSKTVTDLVPLKTVIMISNQQPRKLIYAKLDIIQKSGKSGLTAVMDIRGLVNEEEDKYILKCQSKPFPIINPAACLTSVVLP
jgi:hypothetical protein